MNDFEHLPKRAPPKGCVPELWGAILSLLEEVFGPIDHEQWFKPIYVIAFAPGPDRMQIDVMAPNPEHARVLIEQFKEPIELLLANVFNAALELRISSPESDQRSDKVIDTFLDDRFFSRPTVKVLRDTYLKEKREIQGPDSILEVPWERSSAQRRPHKAKKKLA